MYRIICYGSDVLCESASDVLELVAALAAEPPDTVKSQPPVDNLILDTSTSGG